MSAVVFLQRQLEAKQRQLDDLEVIARDMAVELATAAGELEGKTPRAAGREAEEAVWGGAAASQLRYVIADLFEPGSYAARQVRIRPNAFLKDLGVLWGGSKYEYGVMLPWGDLLFVKGGGSKGVVAVRPGKELEFRDRLKQLVNADIAIAA